MLGGLRLELGRPANHDELEFLWVVDFPLFEEGEDGSITFSHHPFTSPKSLDDMRERPREAISNAYDAVLEDSLLEPLFRGMDSQHFRYVAMFISEVFSGPEAYSAERGGHHYECCLA